MQVEPHEQAPLGVTWGVIAGAAMSGSGNLPPRPVLTAPSVLLSDAQPECVTILPTYCCNAMCDECCFESSPWIRQRLSLDELIRLFDRIRNELPRVSYIVFSGGEVTLLGTDLLVTLSYLKELGLGSRIVSNGHWGRSEKSAKWWADRFHQAGLTELNLSTGDEHQRYIPFDDVALAAYHAVSRGILTLIVVEGKDTSVFSQKNVRSHPMISKILDSVELCQRFLIMTNIWVPFHSDAEITNKQSEAKHEPCNSIFTGLAINPYGNLMSCCGITVEHIPDHKVGHINSCNLQNAYARQYADILKLWIWLDGPCAILDQVVARHQVATELISLHPCSICAQIYTEPKLRSIVQEVAMAKLEEIIFRATIKAHLEGRLAMPPRKE